MVRNVVAAMLATALLVVIPDIAPAGVKSTVVKRDYHVSGTTARRLVSYMRSAPLRGDRGPAIASIKPSYRLTLATAKHGDTCRVTSADLDIRFVLTLPKARDEARMSASTRSAWRNFVAFARRHEEQHRQIYLRCGRNFAAKAKRMSGQSCWSLESEVRRLQRSEAAACERQNAAFDAREYRKVLRLRLFRMAGR